MTNIMNNTKPDDMQIHIDNAFGIIDEYLPSTYVERVLEKIPKHTPSKSVIRNIRMRLSVRIEVINALVEVALENKSEIEKLKKIIA